MRIATLISVQTIVLLQRFYVGSHELKDSEELRSPCQPPSSHFVCDEATGKLKCAEEWKGSSCNENVFISRKEASRFIKFRSKRANPSPDDVVGNLIEAGQTPSLERECIEELCSREEAREVFRDEIETDNFWNTYSGRPCIPSPCVPETTIRCEDLDLVNYTCHCRAEYNGRNCENPPYRRCDSNPCIEANTVVCQNLDEDYNCFCKSNYVGKNCESLPCDFNRCSSNNTLRCTNLARGHMCVCRSGFEGQNCQLRQASTTAAQTTNAIQTTPKQQTTISNNPAVQNQTSSPPAASTTALTTVSNLEESDSSSIILYSVVPVLALVVIALLIAVLLVWQKRRKASKKPPVNAAATIRTVRAERSESRNPPQNQSENTEINSSPERPSRLGYPMPMPRSKTRDENQRSIIQERPLPEIPTYEEVEEPESDVDSFDSQFEHPPAYDDLA